MVVQSQPIRFIQRVRRRPLLLVGLLAILLTGCREQIIHNLTETDGNRVISALTDAGIDAEKVRQADGRWAIAVPHDSATGAIKRLNETRLLRESTGGQEEKGSFIASREDQRFRFERALSREIEATLGSVRGVLEARVHLNMPVTDPLFGQPLNAAKGSGSALLVVDEQFSLTKEEVSTLVAGASGIAPTGISVLLSKGQSQVVAAAELVAAQPSTAPWQPDRQLIGQLFALVVGAGLLIGSLVVLRSKRRRNLESLALRFKDAAGAEARA